MLSDRLLELWWKIRWSSRATAWLHVLAMWAPFNSWRLFFYRCRGTRIGKGVYVVQGAFLEESRPWLITIEDEVRIGAGATILTHDMVYHIFDPNVPCRYGAVVLRRGAIIGPRATILPGVTVGQRAFVGAGAVVVRDVPPGVVVAAEPARFLMNVDDGLERARRRIAEYEAVDRATKYPWRCAGQRTDPSDLREGR